MSESIPMNAGHLAQALAAPIARKRSRWHLLRTQGVLVALVLLIIFWRHALRQLSGRV